MAKAEIIRLDQGNNEVETVQVLFNPKELTFSKTNSWSEDKAPKANVPATEFGSGGPTTLKLQLYFDTYKNGKNAECDDVVKKYTGKLCAMMEVDPKWTDKKNKKGRHRQCDSAGARSSSIRLLPVSINVSLYSCLTANRFVPYWM